MDHKPLYDQLAKREFAAFLRETARRMLETSVVRDLGVTAEVPFRSSGPHRHPGWEFLPGRFKNVSPAAVEPHVSLDLLG